LFLPVPDLTSIILLTYALLPNHTSEQRSLSAGELALPLGNLQARFVVLAQ
jgi:hypothetical protein